MEKPKDYAIYVNKKCDIPYKDWPQEVKDYKNWKRRMRSKPEWANLSEEERKKERNKILVQVRAKWKEKYENMSDDEKAEVNKKKGNFYNNASDEKKKLIAESLRKRSLDFWNGMNEEERKEFGKQRWDMLSDEDKKKISTRWNEAGQRYMKSLSKDEILTKINHMNMMRNKKMEENQEWKNEQINLLRKHCEEYWNSLSDEERLTINEKISDFWKNAPPEVLEKRSKDASRRNYEWWNSRTDEQLFEISARMTIFNDLYWSDPKNVEKHSNQRKEIWNNMDEDQKYEISNRLKNMWANYSPEERKTVIDKLRSWWDNLSDIEKRKHMLNSLVSTRSSLHDRFESYFHESIINNSYYLENEYVCSNYGFSHSWDYGIFDENGDLQMLVDLDGAYYHADECDYDGMHSNEEYDERRFLTVPEGIKCHIIYENQFTKSFEEMIKKLMVNYDQFVEDQFNYCRRLPDLPYSSYSDRELLKSYEQLRKLKTDDKYHQSISLNNREGDRLINQFHHSIYQAKCKGFKLSPYEAWYDDDLLRKIIKNRIIYINKINPNKILQGFNIAKVAKRVTVFSAGRAKLIISRYLSDFDTIFDPFSGFSGRMLGTIASGKKYIGQDISEIHLRESSQIIEFLKQHGYFPEVELHQKDINCSRGEYPCLFTCPPYQDKEQWLDVPIDMRTCDDWIDLCLNHFKCQRYVFVVDETKKYVDNIVDTITNKSHMNKNNEYIVMIDKNK